MSKLKFSKGSTGLFAIQEIHQGYLIVNFTRNTKGYVSLSESNGFNKDKLSLGQLIVATVEQEGTAKYNTETSGNLNRKL